MSDKQEQQSNSGLKGIKNWFSSSSSSNNNSKSEQKQETNSGKKITGIFQGCYHGLVGTGQYVTGNKKNAQKEWMRASEEFSRGNKKESYQDRKNK